MAFLSLIALFGCSSRTPRGNAPVQGPGIVVTEQVSGTTALLQAVSAVNERVVWVSGHRATWARTINGGATWQAGSMRGADSVLQFRDVHAVSATVAYLLAAGPGERSRIYKTVNGGRSWTLQFQNTDSSAFFDCFDFWDDDRGIAVSDAVDGRMIVVHTDDGGLRWQKLPGDWLPPALPGEGAFAASGTCLVAGRRGRAWIGTGAESGARVYRTMSYGGSWTAVTTPVVSGPASGIASVAFRDDDNGIALGGRIGDAESTSDNVAVTRDGGETWTLASRTPFTGAVYGSAFVPGSRLLVAVSPKGMAWTVDDARSWTPLSTTAYWSVGFGNGRAGWAVGPGGRISKLEVGGTR